MPSWKELISTEVSCGDEMRAKRELLNETMDRSSGTESPCCRQTLFRATARISSLTTAAVGGSSRLTKVRKGSFSSSEICSTSTQ